MSQLFFLIFVFGSVLASHGRSEEIIDGVAAVVNQRVITYGQVRDLVEPVAYQLRRSYRGTELKEKIRDAQIDALNRLVERALILDDYHAKGFTIPEKVIDKQITDIITEEFGGKRMEFVKALQEQHMTLTQYRDQVRDRVIVQAMLNRKTDREIVISPYKIEKYYKEHVSDFYIDTHIKLRMIFVQRGENHVKGLDTDGPAPEINSEMETQTNSNKEVNAIPKKESQANNELVDNPVVDPRRIAAEQILQQLDDGVSFDSLAKKYSEGSEAEKGGDWGWISKDHLRRELNEVAFSLKPGDYSRVIETEIGYYILQVDEIRPAYTKSLADVREEIEKILLQKQRAKMQVEWIDQLRANAYVRLF